MVCRRAPWKEGRAAQRKGDLESPESGQVAGISLLEKVRFELRLEGGQDVSFPLSRGRLFPAEGIAKARAPQHVGKTARRPPRLGKGER